MVTITQQNGGGPKKGSECRQTLSNEVGGVWARDYIRYRMLDQKGQRRQTNWQIANLHTWEHTLIKSEVPYSAANPRSTVPNPKSAFPSSHHFFLLWGRRGKKTGESLNRISIVIVPDPFFSQRPHKRKKRSGYARLAMWRVWRQ